MQYQDLLQLMMDATGDKEEEEEEEKEEGKKTTSKDPSNNSEKLKLTDEEVMMVSFDALLAGYDTTANTLAFASYVLALHPHVQEKLQAEIDQYFEDYPVRVRLGKSTGIDCSWLCRRHPCMKLPQTSSTWRWW